MPTPPYVPSENDRRTVMMFVVCGVTSDKIAQHMGIARSTLYKYFTGELENGNEIANSAVAGQLFKNAMEGNVTAQIFWMKTRARWTERERPDDYMPETIEGDAEEITVSERETARRIAFVLDKASRTA